MGSRGGARSSPGWSLSPWEPRRPDRGGQRATPRVAWRRRHRDPAEGPRPPGAGSLLLTIGLLRWIPRPVRLEEIRRELARANERLEQRVEEATRDRPSARNSWSWRSAPPTWSSTRWIPTACSRSRTTAASDGSAWNPRGRGRGHPGRVRRPPRDPGRVRRGPRRRAGAVRGGGRRHLLGIAVRSANRRGRERRGGGNGRWPLRRQRDRPGPTARSTRWPRTVGSGSSSSFRWRGSIGARAPRDRDVEDG